MHWACYCKDHPGSFHMLNPSLCTQPVSESETDEDPPQQTNLSALPDRIGFIGAGQVLHAFCLVGPGGAGGLLEAHGP